MLQAMTLAEMDQMVAAKQHLTEAIALYHRLENEELAAQTEALMEQFEAE